MGSIDNRLLALAKDEVMPDVAEARPHPFVQRLLDLNWLVASLVTLTVVTLRIGRPEFWRDELASWSAATRPLGDLLAMVQNVDAASAAYYILLHFWVSGFGDSVVVMRMLSALAIAATAAVIATTVTILDRPVTGLLAGLLFAVLPGMTYFGQQARSTPFAILGAALATLFLVKAMQRPAAGRWIAYAVALGATAAFNLVAATVVIGHGIAVGAWFLLDRRRVHLWWLLAATAGLLLVAPIAWMALRQRDDQLAWLDVVPELRDFVTMPESIVMSWSITAVLAVLAAIGLGLNPRLLALGCGLGVVPMLLVWLVSQREHSSYWLDRYLSFTVVGMVLLAAAGLARIGVRNSVIVLAVVALLGASVHLSLRRPDNVSMRGGMQYSVAVQWLTNHIEPGDTRLYIHSDRVWGLDLALPFLGFGEDRLPTLCREKTGPERDDLWGSPSQDVPSCLRESKRIWSIRAFNYTWDPLDSVDPVLVKELVTNYRRSEPVYVGNVTLTLYERTAA